MRNDGVRNVSEWKTKNSVSSLIHSSSFIVPRSPRDGIRLTTSLQEALATAWRSLRVNLFRTTLTLLGIIIGVAAVVAMLAVGEGSRKKVLDQISAMGTNLMTVRPGAPGIRGDGDIITLVPEDTAAIKALPNIETAVSERNGRMTVRYGNIDYQTTVQGVGEGFHTCARLAGGRGAVL